jgi:HSP20 family protein
MKLARLSDNWMPSFPSMIDKYFGRDLMDWNDSNFAGSESNMPAANVKETKKEFQIEVAAPGLNKKDFTVHYNNGRLVISSEKKLENEVKEGEKLTRKEFSYQSFQRSFTIPEELVNSDKITAKYSDGILRVLLPKRTEVTSKPVKKIDVF